MPLTYILVRLTPSDQHRKIASYNMMDSDVVIERIKDLIKTKIQDHKDPHLKCFVLAKNEEHSVILDFSDRDIQYAVRQACTTLMNELEFRFKVVFTPEYCMLCAHKLNLDGDYERIQRHNNYARFASYV